MATHYKDRLIDRHALARLVPFSQTHILRMERAGKFPRRIQIGPHRIAWSYRAVMAWIEERKADSARRVFQHIQNPSAIEA